MAENTSLESYFPTVLGGPEDEAQDGNSISSIESLVPDAAPDEEQVVEAAPVVEEATPSLAMPEETEPQSDLENYFPDTFANDPISTEATSAPEVTEEPPQTLDIAPEVSGQDNDTPSAPVVNPDLETPHTTMFDNLSEIEWLSREQKEQIIEERMEQYRADPSYEYNVFSGEIWNGARIPRFAVLPNGEVEVQNSVVGEGIQDGAAFTLIALGDITDFGRSFFEEVTDENSLGSKADDYFSEYQETRMLQGLGKEAAGMLAPGGVVAKAFTWATKALKGSNVLSKYAKILAGGSGLSLGMTAGTDPDASGIFLGDEAMFGSLQEAMPLLQGLNSDPDSPEYEQRLQNRINMLIEGGAIGGGINAGIKTLTGVTRLVYSMSIMNVVRVAGVGARTEAENSVIKEIAARLYAVEGATNPIDRKRFMENLRDSIANNARTLENLDEDVWGVVGADQTTLNAFIQAVEQGDMVAAATTVNKARQLQQGAIAKEGETALKADSVTGTVYRGLETGEDAFGGAEGVETATAAIQRTALDEVNAVQAAAETARRSADDAVAKFDEALATDPQLQAAVKGLETKTAIDLGASRADNVGGMIERVRSAYIKMKQEKDTLYKAIEGGDLDIDSMVDVLRGLDEDALSFSSTLVTNKSTPLGKLMALAAEPKKFKMVGEERVPLTADEIAEKEVQLREKLASILEESEASDYGSFFQNLRPGLAQLKDQAYSLAYGGSSVSPAARTAGETLQTFLDFVDGDLAARANSEEVLEALNAAKTYDATVFAPTWRGKADNPLRQIADSFDSDMQARTGEGIGTVKRSADEVGFNQTASNAIEAGLPQSYYGEQLVKVLKEQGGGAEDAYQYILSDVLGPINAALRSGSGEELSPLVLKEATDTLAKYSRVIKTQFPELADRVRVLQDEILSGTGKSQKLSALADAAQVEADRVVEDVFKGRLKEFFSSQNLPKAQAQRVWDDIFKNFRNADTRLTPEDIGRFETFTSGVLASGDGVLINGLRSSYINAMKRNFFQNTETISGANKLSLAKVQSEDAEQWYRGLQLVFREEDGASPVADIMITMLARAGDETATATKTAIAINSTTANKKEALNALNSMTTMIFGPLSRTGARIGAAGRQFIGRRVNANLYEDLTDQLLADPIKFAEGLDRVIAEEFGATKLPFYKGRGSTELRSLYEATVRSFVRAGMISEDDEKGLREIDDNTLQTLFQMEDMANSAINEARSVKETFLESMAREFKELFQ